MNQHLDVIVDSCVQRRGLEYITPTGGPSPAFDRSLASVVPRQADDLVAAVGEPIDEASSEHTCRTRDEHAHAGPHPQREWEIVVPDSHGRFKPDAPVCPDMKHVRVRITAGGREGEIHPMYDVWANAPFIERATAIQWNFTGDELGIFHYAVGDADAFEATVSEIPEVLEYELVPSGEDAFYVYIRDATTDALGDLFGPITMGGIIVVPPIRYHEDGMVTLSLIGPDAAVQAAIETVPSPVDVTIERIGGLDATVATVDTRLSDRQREAIHAAIDLGYYEVPREASHEDIALELDCAPSTAAEHLRKGESKLVHAVFGEMV